MTQQRLDKNKTTDEKVNNILFKGIWIKEEIKKHEHEGVVGKHPISRNHRSKVAQRIHEESLSGIYSTKLGRKWRKENEKKLFAK